MVQLTLESYVVSGMTSSQLRCRNPLYDVSKHPTPRPSSLKEAIVRWLEQEL